MTDCHIDFETRSVVDLRKTGVYVYAEDKTTNVWCAAYAFDDGEVKVWLPHESCPAEIVAHVESGGALWAHNANFERAIWAHVLTPGYGWPLPKLSQWNCTMARAYAMALPGALDSAAAALGIGHAKDPVGYRTMLRMSKPRRYNEDGTPVWWDDPVRIKELVAYCKQDVVVERALHERLIDLRATEKDIWHLDQKINDRGVRVDRELCELARTFVVREMGQLNQEIRNVSNGAIPSVDSVAKIIAFLQTRGVETDSIDSESVEALLLDVWMPDDARRVLEIRAEAGKASVKKIDALLNGCSKDGRARGLLAYHAASTGRWAGRRFQPQNIKRPVNKNQDELIEILRLRSVAAVKMLAGNPLEVVGDVLRGMIVAAPGASFYAADYSNIEGRGLAWLADEHWKVKAFERFDEGVGPDLYKLSYARAFGISPERVSPDQRQVGKVMELACLGADTRVITDTGVKRIVDVTLHDRVWDGVEWVNHKGLVARGVRPVVRVGDTELTPDHLVLTGKTWSLAGQLVSNANILSRSLATGSAHSPWSISNTDQPGGWCGSWFSAIAERLRTTCISITSGKVAPRRATSAPRRNPTIGAKIFSATPTLFQTTHIGGVCSIAYPRVPHAVTSPTIDSGRTMAGAGFKCSASGVAVQRGEESFSRTLLRWTDGTIRFLSWTGSTLTRATSQGISASSRKPETPRTDDLCGFSRCESSNSKPVYDIAHAGPRNRFMIVTSLGPLIVHNCGYQGGVGAFQTMASTYGVKVTDERANELKTGWREAHPNIKQFWYDVESAAVGAVKQKGKTVYCGKLAFKCAGSFLFMRLPSGRMLTYPYPKLREIKTPWGSDKLALTYKSVVNPSNTRRVVKDDSNSSNWARISTYGGSLVENATQAVARDVMAEAMLRVEAAGYPVVMTVHDEIVSEANGHGDVAEFEALMIEPPAWAKGFPITAKAWTGQRYKKD